SLDACTHASRVTGNVTVAPPLSWSPPNGSALGSAAMRTLCILALVLAACGDPSNSGGGDDTGGGDGGGGSGSDDVPPDAADVPKPVKFIAIGDTGKGNADQRRVAVAMRDLCAAKGCDFVLM